MRTEGQTTVTSNVTYQVQIRRDTRIPTGNPDVTLSADIYLPMGADPVPAVVTAVPYRKDIGTGYETSLHWFAERGYAGVLLELRGIGSSDGVPRPKYDATEGDDAVAAIEWAAAQPWCTGDVGMWGMSYGGLMTLRAASQRPSPLKAIIPIMCTLDPGRDVAHPDGQRGDFLPVASWAGRMLVDQLLPPLLNYTSVQEQRRWQRRLHDVDPFIVDIARVGPRHPVWRDRVVAADSVVAPALCVGGWQDVFPEALPSVYERIQGRKKLLMGPWGHTLPHHSVLGAIDFLAVALRWWDYWLRGTENGVMDEPPVTLYIQGERPQWRSYEAWPPAKEERVWATAADTTLHETEPDADKHDTMVAEYQPDPTIGALSGLRGIGMGDFGMPQDQHDDDVRASCANIAQLQDSVLIAGRPQVTVTLTVDGSMPATRPQRIVARLADVDPQGRSTFITAGLGYPDVQSRTVRITLAPAVYRVRAGNHLRVILSDSDLPRLTPLPDPVPIRIAGITLSTPITTDDAGTHVVMPTHEEPPPDTRSPTGHWRITRDPINDAVDITVGGSTSGVITSQGHLLQRDREARVMVRRGIPDGVVTTGTHRAVVRMATGGAFTVTASVRCTRTAVWARGEVQVDDVTLYSRTWDIPVAVASD